MRYTRAHHRDPQPRECGGRKDASHSLGVGVLWRGALRTTINLVRRGVSLVDRARLASPKMGKAVKVMKVQGKNTKGGKRPAVRGPRRDRNHESIF